MKNIARGCAAVCLLVAAAAHADVELMTPDGKRVLLKDDFTWEYVQEGQAEPVPEDQPAVLMPLVLKSMRAENNACRFGLELTNTLPYEVKSLVPQFTALTEGEVEYQTVFKSFDYLKPTRRRYQEVVFRGITCSRITSLRVSGADRCAMGDLTRFSRERGRCLAHVDVVPSDLITFSK